MRINKISGYFVLYGMMFLIFFSTFGCDSQFDQRQGLSNTSIRNTTFELEKSKIIESIEDDDFYNAENLIRKFQSSKISSYYYSEINDLLNYSTERKLFVKIKEEKSYDDVLTYLENNSYNRYKGKVQEIKLVIEADKEIYYSAIKDSSIENINEFINSYPENSYIAKAEVDLIILKRRRSLDSIAQIKEYNEVFSDMYNYVERSDYSKSYQIHKPAPLYVPNTNYDNYSNSYNYNNTYVNPNANRRQIEVKGYYKSNGTYVEPYIRTIPNNTKTDNLRFKQP